jgi:hypothetical protein
VSQYADMFGAEYRPMFMQTEGGAVFKGGPEAAAFMVCRCGLPVKVGMEDAHLKYLPHDQADGGQASEGPTTTVRRGEL